MKWTVNYSNTAAQFIEKHNIHEDIGHEIKKLLVRVKGEFINVDLRKLTGKWKGYYRLRKGKLRIILSINKNRKTLYIEKVDFRGNVYRN